MQSKLQDQLTLIYRQVAQPRPHLGHCTQQTFESFAYKTHATTHIRYNPVFVHLVLPLLYYLGRNFLGWFQKISYIDPCNLEWYIPETHIEYSLYHQYW